MVCIQSVDCIHRLLFWGEIYRLETSVIRLVAGGGLLWLSEGKFRHEELFAGVERVFKQGARRRLRVGLFGVAADGNYTKPKTTYKIALDIIDTWKRDWRF